MQKNIIFLFALVTFISGRAQILEPVRWSTSVEKISNTEYELIATADIDDTWHLYSQNVPEGGPIATSFSFEGNKNYLKKGNTNEEKGHVVNDSTFSMKVKYFEGNTIFKQRIKLKNKPPFKINSEVNYMVCNNSKCIMPDPKTLIFNLK